MKTKILIVIDSLGPGGAQRQIVEYLKYADRLNLAIKVISLDRDYNNLEGEITRLGYPVVGIDHKGGMFNVATLFKLIKLFHEEKPNIVHTYLFTSDCYGRLAARIAGVKATICSIRSTDHWKKFHHIFVDRILAGFTDRITINADNMRTFLVEEEKLPDSKIVRIYNGIDLKRFEHLAVREAIRTQLNIPKDALVVGMVSRFNAQKDYPTYIEAAKKILKSHKNIYFLGIGEGPQLENVKKQIEGMPNIVFTGLRKDVPELINALDIGVLATHYEGCPNVVLEYMACSKPVVATNVDGCPELIVDGKTGFLVPEGNAEALAARLETLLESVVSRRMMGAAGRKRVEEKFTSQILAKNTEELYASVLAKQTAFIFSQFPCYDETFILRELNQLQKTGLDFEIYSLKTPKDKIMHDEAKALAGRTYYLPFISLKVLGINLYFLLRHPIRYIGTFFKVTAGNLKSPNFFFKTLAVWPKAVGFAWLARRRKVTHVHGQWATYPATVAMAIAGLNNIPFSFTGHAHDIYLDTTMLAEKIEAARFVTTCTTDNKRHLLSLLNGKKDTAEWRDKIVINYHGIDLSRFLKPVIDNHNEFFTILSVGSLLECKGFTYLIEACRLLKEENVKFKCIIAGGGPLESALRKQIQEAGLEGTVELTGFITQDKLIPLYKQADIFVLPMVPGIHWGIANVLVEAIASGLPTVCTMLPSIPELIKDGETGFIIPPKDPAAIADIIRRLKDDKALRGKVAVAGREVVALKFDAVKNSEQLRDLFLENKG